MRVYFVDDCVGPAVEALSQRLAPGQVLLLENLRFYPGEEQNDPAFAAQLARLGDVYVNDAFGAAHRAHASVDAMTRHFTERGMGLLMEREVRALQQLLRTTDRPYVVILGGGKVSDKLPVLRNLLERAVDDILIGGAMSFTFFEGPGV